MKLGPVTRPDKWKKAISKKLDGDVMAANVDIIAHFPIYGWFGIIGKLDSESRFYNTYIFINCNL